ncbi:MAG: tyrosine-type recombinase/integrase [Ignavibacteriales bacterium]|nr:tyrosine-type recombinase/integrase [Ignavibacteriales bacterium]
MASIYEKGGFLYLQYYEKNPSNRSVRTQTALNLTDTPQNRKVAERIRLEKELDLKKPKQILSFNITFKKAAEQYLTYKNISPNTEYIYNKIIEEFTDLFGDIRVSEVQSHHIKSYTSSLTKFNSNTIAMRTTYLRAMFNWFKHKRYVEENYVNTSKIKPRKIRPIPDELFNEILSLCTLDQQRFLLKFLWYSGFRIGEALSLKWSNIDFENRIIYVRNQKDKREDKFPIDERLYSLLKKQQSTGKVFVYSNPSTISFWYDIKKKLGHNFVVQDIRKTFVIKLVNNGVSINEARHLLRYSSVVLIENFYNAYSK